MDEKKVTIEMPEQEAAEFIVFRKYLLQFRKLVEKGVFDIRGGRAILDFNNSSNIDNIKIVQNYHFQAGLDRLL